MDLGDGEVQFRAALPFAGSTFTAEQIDDVLGKARWTINQYLGVVHRVCHGWESPADALGLATPSPLAAMRLAPYDEITTLPPDAEADERRSA